MPLLARGVRERFERSPAWDLLRILKDVDFGDRILIFGSAMLMSVLPMVILLSAFASHRIDDDISRNLGLSGQGSRVIASLFRSSTVSFNFAVMLGLLLSLAGTLAVARSVQTIYEDTFGQPHSRGVRNLARCGLWIAAVGALLIAEGAFSKAFDRGAPGPFIVGVVDLAGLTLFFWWTLHFLLSGRESWTRTAPSAVATGLFFVGLGAFASLYFSSTIVSDSHLYGTIGVVFSLLTWFIAIGAVVTLGSAVGVVWNKRRKVPGQKVIDP